MLFFYLNYFILNKNIKKILIYVKMLILKEIDVVDYLRIYKNLRIVWFIFIYVYNIFRGELMLFFKEIIKFYFVSFGICLVVSFFLDMVRLGFVF